MRDKQRQVKTQREEKERRKRLQIEIIEEAKDAWQVALVAAAAADPFFHLLFVVGGFGRLAADNFAG